MQKQWSPAHSTCELLLSDSRGQYIPRDFHKFENEDSE